MSITEYHLYSDERLHPKPYIILGGIVCTDKGADRIHDQLSKVRADYGLTREMRWTKISRKYSEEYTAWIDAFFQDNFSRFSMLVIDTSDPRWLQLKTSQRRTQSDSLLSSAFYQFLLTTFGKLRDTKRWHVFHDRGFFRRDEVINQIEFRFNSTYKKAFGSNTSRIIRSAQSRDSKQEDLIQLADVLLNVFSHFVLDIKVHNIAKCGMVDHGKNKLDRTPKTKRGFDKLSVHQWVHPSDFEYL